MHIQSPSRSLPRNLPLGQQGAQPHAFLLDRAAHLLDHARDPSALSWAVQNNLAVWLDLRTAARPCAPEDGEARRILDLADHVIATTLESGRIAPHDAQIEAFITMNRTLARSLVAKAAPPSRS